MTTALELHVRFKKILFIVTREQKFTSYMSFKKFTSPKMPKNTLQNATIDHTNVLALGSTAVIVVLFLADQQLSQEKIL